MRKRFILVGVLAAMAASPAAAETLYSHITFGGGGNCDIGNVRYATDKPIKFDTGDRSRGEWHKASLRYQYISWLYDNHRATLTQIARRARFHSSTLQIRPTPAEATAASKQYGSFTPTFGCNGRTFSLPTAGFTFKVYEYGAKRGGIGQERYDFLMAFFEANAT